MYYLALRDQEKEPNRKRSLRSTDWCIYLPETCFREEVAAQTDLGMQAKEIMDRGELVSDEIVIGMIRNKLEEHQDGPGFIFDGFPRTVNQARELRKALTDYDERVGVMISLEVPREELVKRLLKRGKETGRSDDKLETINNRIDVYNRQTIPVTYYYDKMHKHAAVEGHGYRG